VDLRQPVCLRRDDVRNDWKSSCCKYRGYDHPFQVDPSRPGPLATTAARQFGCDGCAAVALCVNAMTGKLK
jgi:hypothetical protein